MNGLFTALVVDADVDARALAGHRVRAGLSLAETVKERGPLSARSVLSLAAGLAEGLSAIHAAGVVHGDLKPSNVLLAEDGPRVIDFGISRAAGAAPVTPMGLVVGSPGFIHPSKPRVRRSARSATFSAWERFSPSRPPDRARLAPGHQWNCSIASSRFAAPRNSAGRSAAASQTLSEQGPEPAAYRRRPAGRDGRRARRNGLAAQSIVRMIPMEIPSNSENERIAIVSIGGTLTVTLGSVQPDRDAAVGQPQTADEPPAADTPQTVDGPPASHPPQAIDEPPAAAPPPPSMAHQQRTRRS